jgi:hypothetical protein
MNTKIFNRIGLMMAIAFSLASCSQEETIQEANALDNNDSQPTEYVYTMTLDCPVPAFDQQTETRANTSWSNGSVIYLRFKTGNSSWVTGKATYMSSSSTWTVTTTTTLSNTSSATCEAYYFENASVSGNNVTMKENSIGYITRTGTYSVNSSVVSVTATLTPLTWRMRFYGTSGAKITLPAENDIAYVTGFNVSTGNASTVQNEAELTVESTKYTPYIYATFVNASGNNELIVVNNSENTAYKRTVAGSSLKAGESGYFTIPTSSSHNGWVADSGPGPNPQGNLDVRPNLLVPFVDGVVTDFTLDSNVSSWYFYIGTKSYIDGLSDAEIIQDIQSDNDPISSDKASNIFRNNNTSSSNFYKDNSSYYLVTLGFDRNGNHGNVVKTAFNTRSSSLPTATISNVKAASNVKWTYNITMKNSASQYYLDNSTSDEFYNQDDHFTGWFMYRDIMEGSLSLYSWASVATTINSGTVNKFTVYTWAVDSKGNLGNFSIAHATASSSVRKNADSETVKGMMPKDMWKKKITVPYRTTGM